MPRIQRLHAQPPCATSHKSGLRITAAHGPGTHLVFEMVVIDRHVAVFKEAHERTPVIQAVVDRLSDCTPIGNPFALELKPQVHFSAQRLGASLSHGQPFVGAQGPGVSLDSIDPRKSLDRFLCHRTGVRLDQVAKFSPRVSKTTCDLPALKLEGSVVAFIQISDQRSRPAFQELDRIFSAAAQAEVVHHSGLGIEGPSCKSLIWSSR